MKVSIDKTGENCFSTAVDNTAIFILKIFPIFSVTGCSDFIILDSYPGNLRGNRI